MSVLEKIREMSTGNVNTTPLASASGTLPPMSPEDQEIKVRRKAGVLAAFGLSDKAIADTLFLTFDQVTAIRETIEFRETCAKQTLERTQRLIDLEEGWNGVEAQGVAQVLQHLEYSRDPEFALRAALYANRAQRRTPSSLGRVIDASNVGNVITLTVNKNYINNVTNANPQKGGNHAIVELQTIKSEEIPRKASDISSPKRLSEILQVGGPKRKEEELIRMAEAVGISIDDLSEIMPTV